MSLGLLGILVDHYADICLWGDSRAVRVTNITGVSEAKGFQSKQITARLGKESCRQPDDRQATEAYNHQLDTR
eukprot:scaffold306006_cov13-Tisochrysis_lutea.AAC.1